MAGNSSNHDSNNGDGRPPFESEAISGDEGPLRDTMRRLVLVLLEEAVARAYDRIVVVQGETGCPVHFLRGDESLEMDALPSRLFGEFEAQVARMCGREVGPGQGTFTTCLKKTETSAKAFARVRVSVVFDGSSLRFTITEVERQSAEL